MTTSPSNPSPPEKSVTEQVRLHLETSAASELQRRQQQGLGKPIISWTTAGVRCVAVGDRILYSARWRTFHDFLWDYLMSVLGCDWGKEELAKSEGLRHPVVVWHTLAAAYLDQFRELQGRASLQPMTGAIAAFMRLAYGMYLMEHNASLPPSLLNRLRDRDQFQGAYYEVVVTSTLIRAGFVITFEDESDSTTSHCELTATFRGTGKSFSVEAKTRVCGKEHLDIKRQLAKALKKAALHTRVVFIEVNVPVGITANNVNKVLYGVLQGLRRMEVTLTHDGQHPPSAYVVVTNHTSESNLEGESDFWAVGEGFRIDDFKIDSRFTNLRQALVARKRHAEMFALMRSLAEHHDIPSTFDGEAPEIAFTHGPARLTVGKYYLVPHANGQQVPAELLDAVVSDEAKQARCFFRMPDKTISLISCPLTDEEIAAYRRHPDSFFGIVKPHSNRVIRDPLDLYDSFCANYKNAPKDRLLELMTGAPDIPQLQQLSQPELVDVYAERLTSTFVRDYLVRSQSRTPSDAPSRAPATPCKKPGSE